LSFVVLRCRAFSARPALLCSSIPPSCGSFGAGQMLFKNQCSRHSGLGTEIAQSPVRSDGFALLTSAFEYPLSMQTYLPSNDRSGSWLCANPEFTFRGLMSASAGCGHAVYQAYVREVPTADSCTAANSPIIRSPRRRAASPSAGRTRPRSRQGGRCVPAAQRYSIATLRPSIQPASLSPSGTRPSR
jgi:hypothetical protein